MSDCSTHAFGVPLKPCPFCGGEAEMLTAESMNGGYLFGIMCNDCCSRGDVYDTEAEAIAAWNTRATHGTLTAEQVREAIMSADRWEKPMGNTGLTNTHLIIRDDAWQAIADELNSRAERTCKNVCKEWAKTSFAGAETSFCCSECGAHYYDYESYYAGLADADNEPIRTNICPNCGCKVVG